MLPLSSDWVEKLRFDMQSNAIDSIARGVILCQLTDDRRARCSCEYTRYESYREDKVKITHGDNPEQTIEITAEDFNYFCTRGHVATLCEWAARVIDYVHPEEELVYGN